AREEDHAERARVPHVQVAETFLPEQVRHSERRLVGSAVRCDLHLVVQLEAPDRPEQNDKEDRGPQQRDGDLEELPDRPRAIEVRGLVDRPGDVLDRREEDEHHRRRRRPDVHEHDRWQRRGLVAEPVDTDVDADEVQRGVDEAVGQEQPHEDERRDDGRGDARQVPRDPEETAERQLLVEDRGHHQSDERLRRDDDSGVGRDIAYRVEKALVFERRLVVLEPDEHRIGEKVVVSEREVDRENDGRADEDDEEEEERREERVRREPLAPVAETRGAADRPSRYDRHALLREKWLDRGRELVKRVLDARLLEHDRLERLGDLVVHLAGVRAGVVERLAVWGAVEDRLRIRVRDLGGERLPRRQRESGLQYLRLVFTTGQVVGEGPGRVRVLRLRG